MCPRVDLNCCFPFLHILNARIAGMCYHTSAACCLLGGVQKALMDKITLDISVFIMATRRLNLIILALSNIPPSTLLLHDSGTKLRVLGILGSCFSCIPNLWLFEAPLLLTLGLPQTSPSF